MELTEVDFFTVVFLDTTGQKLAIWQSNNSRWVAFCTALRLMFFATSTISLCSPRSLVAGIFFNHVKPSTRNDAKCVTNERVYCRFWRHASDDVMVSFFVRGYCFEALVAAIVCMMIILLKVMTYIVRLLLSCLPHFRFEAYVYSHLQCLWMF